MKKFISLILAILVLLTSVALFGCSSNDVSNNNSKDQTSQQAPSGNSGNGGNGGGKGDNTPQYTRDGNTVYFGMYPQTRVEDDELVATLNTKAGALPTADNAQGWTSYGYYESGSTKDYMWYIDVVEGENTYRGVYFTSYRPKCTTSASNLEASQQDENGYYIVTVYWFKYEPISWTVLSEANGTALLFCNMIIDAQEYYIDREGTRTVGENTVQPNNYEYSTIRSWLNDNFYNTAFTELQKKAIVKTTVDNSAQSSGISQSDYACADTEDNVFLLSYTDILNGDYGFSTEHISSATRRIKTTDYAKSQGAYSSIGSEYFGSGLWWLRSPLGSYRNAKAVDSVGEADTAYFVDTTITGVVPALQIKL